MSDEKCWLEKAENGETLTELMEQHLEDSLRTWSRRPLPELVHEFVNVRGDLGNPEATAQLVRLLSVKIEDAQMRHAAVTLRSVAARASKGGSFDIAEWCDDMADDIPF